MGTLAFMRIFALLEKTRRVLVDGCMQPRTEALFNRSRERCVNVSVSSASTTSVPENIERYCKWLLYSNVELQKY